jgi:hypothetical protein
MKKQNKSYFVYDDKGKCIEVLAQVSETVAKKYAKNSETMLVSFEDLNEFFLTDNVL